MWVDTLKRVHQIFTGQGFKVGVAYRPVFCAKQVAKRLVLHKDFLSSLDDKKLCLQPDHYYYHHYHYYYYYCCCYGFCFVFFISRELSADVYTNVSPDGSAGAQYTITIV